MRSNAHGLDRIKRRGRNKAQGGNAENKDNKPCEGKHSVAGIWRERTARFLWLLFIQINMECLDLFALVFIQLVHSSLRARDFSPPLFSVVLTTSHPSHQQ